LVLRAIDLSRPADSHCRQCATPGPLQRLQMLEQLAIQPLTQAEGSSSESPQLVLDRKPVEWHGIL
jgi:hypothetical protein